jgi:ABC-type uncharacterized transport system permease subunit
LRAVEKLQKLFHTRAFRISLKVAIAAALFGLAVLLLPRWAVSAMVVFALLGLVAKYDNWAGTLLPLAVLIVLVFAILLILLGTMAAMHRS